jgi:hypothetical protein
MADYFVGAISESDPSFLYLPEDSQAKPVTWGPALVGATAQFKGIEMGIVSEEDPPPASGA